MSVCFHVGDADGNRTVADGGEGVANGIEFRPVHEPGEGFRIHNTFDR